MKSNAFLRNLFMERVVLFTESKEQIYVTDNTLPKFVHNSSRETKNARHYFAGIRKQIAG